MIEVIAIILMFAGTGFVLVAGIGVVRLPDVPMRMHASTKAGTLGVALMAAALVVLYFDDVSVVARALALILFMLLTAPVAAHMIARAAYYAGVKLWDETKVDEQRDYLEAHHPEELYSRDQARAENAQPESSSGHIS